MAILTVESTGEQITDPELVGAALRAQNVVYERWNISKLGSQTQPAGVSTEEFVLRVFAPEIEALSQARGYRASDVIALRPETPNLDAILARFDKEHYHTEDEVRFVVAGRGKFVVRGVDDDMYHVEVHPGDLLAVPEGTRHYFELCEDRNIQCIRLFTDTSGWTAHYVTAG